MKRFYQAPTAEINDFAIVEDIMKSEDVQIDVKKLFDTSELDVDAGGLFDSGDLDIDLGNQF